MLQNSPRNSSSSQRKIFSGSRILGIWPSISMQRRKKRSNEFVLLREDEKVHLSRWKTKIEILNEKLRLQTNFLVQIEIVKRRKTFERRNRKIRRFLTRTYWKRFPIDDKFREKTLRIDKKKTDRSHQHRSSRSNEHLTRRKKESVTFYFFFDRTTNFNLMKFPSR